MDREKISKEKIVIFSFILSLLLTSTYILSFVNEPTAAEFYSTFFLNILISVFVYFLIFLSFFFLFFFNYKYKIFSHVVFIILYYAIFKILVLVYGIQSINNLFTINLNLNFGLKNKILFIITLISIYIFTFIYFFKKKFINLLKFITIFSIIIFIYSFTQVLNTTKLLSKDKIFKNSSNLNSVLEISSVPKKKIVIILFDETDKDYLSNNIERLKLYNYKKFTKTSLSFSNAYSPGRDTIQSVPAFLIGFSGDGIYSFDRKNIFYKKKNEKYYFNFENSFFNYAKHKNNVALIGGAGRQILYCNYLKIKICRDAANDIDYKLINFEGFEFVTSIFQSIFKPYLDNNEGQKTNLKIINLLIKNIDVKHNIKVNYELDDLSNKIIANRDITISFIHFPYPHYPNYFARKIFSDNSKQNDTLDWYDLNLRLFDKKLGEILDILNKQEDFMLIVTADHGLRHLENDLSKHRKVIYDIYIPKNTSLSYGKNFSTFHTKKIIKEYLDGKIDSYNDIVGLIKNFNFIYPSNTTKLKIH